MGSKSLVPKSSLGDSLTKTENHATLYYMRLALITQDFIPKTGGIQTYAMELAKRFQSQCDLFYLIAPKIEGSYESDKYLSFKIKRIQSTEPFLGWKSLPSLPPLLKKNNIDTIFHTQWTTLPVSVYMKKMGIIKNIYLAAHGRELLFNPFGQHGFLSGLYTQYQKWLLKQVDHFFPVSNYTAQLLKEMGIDEEKTDVVINGTDPSIFYPLEDDFRSELHLEHKKILLTITRLVSRKGVNTVLKALPEIIKKHPNIFYLIAGEGEYESDLKQIADNLGLNEFVKFVGRIADDDLIRYYNVCDIFVMPAKTELPDVEGFGLVFLEANACGKPVLGSASGGIPDAILDEETGLLIEEQNPQALAGAVNRLLENPEWTRRLGKNGRKRIVNEANWDQTASTIMNIMNKHLQ